MENVQHEVDSVEVSRASQREETLMYAPQEQIKLPSIHLCNRENKN